VEGFPVRKRERARRMAEKIRRRGRCFIGVNE